MKSIFSFLPHLYKINHLFKNSIPFSVIVSTEAQCCFETNFSSSLSTIQGVQLGLPPQRQKKKTATGHRFSLDVAACHKHM